MEKHKVNIAVVEDNGMARTNLRNHLLEMDFEGVHCFTHGRELRRDLKRRRYDLVLMDFHLGDNKNGVEVIQDLQKEGLLKYSTCLVFITSDRLPMIIGQIVDIHPDDLVIKPYTIKTLGRTIFNALNINRTLRPVLRNMDEGDFEEALHQLDIIEEKELLPKSRTNLTKLRARLLLKLKRFSEASELYKSVLEQSDKVIWAKWGLIHAQYLAGETDISESMLQDMLGAHLTNDKACEWLARIAIGKKQYSRAEEYMEQIKEGALSLAAAKLKAYLYQIQDKMDEAISLLERRREASRHVREKFAELSLELARCYLSLAESRAMNERDKPLQVARFLIGSAGRRFVDDNLELKRHYMNILAAILEGNLERAHELLQKEEMTDLQEADVSTMSDAIRAWLGVGDEKKAAQILFDCEEKLQHIEDLTEKTMSSMMINKSEESLGARRPRALKFNKEGLSLHGAQRFDEAVDYFYQAYILFPKESAFGLNLLQSMVEARIARHKNIRTLRLYNELGARDLSEGNRQRLQDISVKIEQDRDAYVDADAPPADEFGEVR
ncbi:response regulator [Aestuariibacter halophilus]|uniref:Response regulator n=1 Tax=Fluctibacter halophilus TaxID=226011 RepID=A0ABS8G6W9_9ALTE|nr:response regulator [Aestuariibacter halophilus]